MAKSRKPRSATSGPKPIIVAIPGHPTQVLLPDPGGMVKGVRYILADASVALVACGHCQAPVGVLCRGVCAARVVSTHFARRMGCARQRKQLRAAGKFATGYRIVYIDPKDI